MLDMVAGRVRDQGRPCGREAELSAQIIDACRQNLADFKVPRAVYFVTEFPTAELGKISKKDLRELADSFDPV
jgi:crotonobetaine/carnitine-CoA ligase